MKMKKSQAAFLTSAIVFTVIAVVAAVFACLLMYATLDLHFAPASGEEGDSNNALGAALGLIILLPIQLIIAAVGSVLSVFGITSAISPIRSKESRRAHITGIVFLVIASVALLCNLSAILTPIIAFH